MKLLETVVAVGLTILSFITNVIDDSSYIKHDTVKPGTVSPDYPIDNVRSLLGGILPLFIIQIADSATSDDQLNFLFEVFPLSRLEPDTSLLEKILCTAVSGNSILLLDEIKTLNTEDSTRIWFIQAVDVFTSKSWVKMLCHLIDVSDDMDDEVQDNLDKKDVSTAAAVADTITKSGQTVQVFLTAFDNPPAPLPKVAQPFVPTKTIWNRELHSRRSRKAARSLTR